jgi:hypothetical protein
MTAALRAIDWLKTHGVSLSINGEKLILTGETELSPRVTARLVELKPNIIAALRDAERSGQDVTRPQIDYRLLQSIADARNADADTNFETARYCRCGSLAPTQWRINGAKVWRCEDCYQ